MGVASNDDDGGVGEVDTDEQLDGGPQAFGMASGVGKYPEKPRQEVRSSTSKKNCACVRGNSCKSVA